jgi:cell division protein FtsQ
LLLPVLLLGLAVGLLYWLVLRNTVVEPGVGTLRGSLQPVSTIGEGEDAVGVSANGVILSWRALPEDVELPRLPLSAPPAAGRLAGPALQQARVLGAAPPALRPYVESSYYGEGGVDVNLRSGIELRFGDASRAEKKWRAAAAILADPTLTALDYVDLKAPNHPAVGGEGHTLPPAP